MLGGDEGYHHILISETHLNKAAPLGSGQKPLIVNELYGVKVVKILYSSSKNCNSSEANLSETLWEQLLVC